MSRYTPPPELKSEYDRYARMGERWKFDYLFDRVHERTASVAEGPPAQDPVVREINNIVASASHHMTEDEAQEAMARLLGWFWEILQDDDVYNAQMEVARIAQHAGFDLEPDMSDL